MADEKIIWEGSPDPAIRFCNSDLFLVPFSLLWGGLAIFIYAAAVMATIRHGKVNPEMLSMDLLGLSFVMLGLYLIFGRFLVKSAKKRKTRYMITDRRILSLHRFPWESFREVDLGAVNSISLDKGLFGSSTLSFEWKDPSVFQTLMRINGPHENTGLEIFFPIDLSGQMNLYDIKNIDEPYKLAREALNTLKNRK